MKSQGHIIDIWNNRISSGDVKAFSDLYNVVFDDLYKMAKAILVDEDICKDLIQDLFIDVWENKEKRQILNYPAYLKKAMKYKISDHLRKNKFNKVQLEVLDFVYQDITSQYALENKELANSIYTAIDNLPNKCKLIFKLSKFENKSTKDIAQTLNLSPRTVENQIYKAVKLLKTSLSYISTMAIFYLIDFPFGL
jgi:RNA polymerase sigma-70 factor (family 1)